MALAMAGFMMVLFVGCGGDPYADKYTRIHPESKIFEGEWSLTGWTMKIGQALPSPSPRIVFQGDGSFKAANYPGEALGGFGTLGSFYGGEGTWSVGSHQGFWVIHIHWQRLGDKKLDYGEMLHIINNQQPYVLHHIIGDPDSGESLVFEKAHLQKEKGHSP